jgi:hypothetical protein
MFKGVVFEPRANSLPGNAQVDRRGQKVLLEDMERIRY